MNPRMTLVADAPAAPTEADVPRRPGLGLALAICVPLLSAVLAAAAGAWGIPRDDDWAFTRIAFGLERTGHLQLVGWNKMTLVGLIGWAQPWLLVLGRHVWVLDLSAAVLVGAGLWATWRLARLALSPARAALAVGCVVALPGFLRDTTSFMTDGPALALAALCMLAGVEAMAATGRRRQLLWTASLVLGFWGFTVREFALAAPVAVLAAWAVAASDRRRALAGAGGFLLACAAFYAWRQSLPGAQSIGPRPTVDVIVGSIVMTWFTVALFLLPVLVAVTGWSWRSRGQSSVAWRRGALFGLAAAAIPLGLAHHFGGQPTWLLSDYLTRQGLGANELLLGSRWVLLSPPLWALISVAAVIAGVLLAGEVADRLASRAGGPLADRPTLTRVLACHVVAMTVILAATAIMNSAVLDRYVWPLVLSGGVLLLAGARSEVVGRSVRPRAWIALGAAAVLALALTAGSDAFDGGRWQQGVSAVTAGASPTSVDAGFEWVGVHTSSSADLALRGVGNPNQSWWSKMLALPAPCVEVAASPITAPGYFLEKTVAWRPLLLAGHSHWYIYRHQGC